MEKDDQATGDGGVAMPEKPGKEAPEEPPPPLFAAASAAMNRSKAMPSMYLWSLSSQTP